MKHAVGLIALVAVTGCSSSYQPANSPRIAVGMRGGSPTYYKNGREYPGGFFGGGAIDAVEGNPRAVAEAKAGHSLMIAGFTVSLMGLGAVFAGIAVAPDNGNSSDDTTAALALMLGGLGVSIVGSILIGSAYPHYYDAIAIYNDGVPPAPPMYQLQPPHMYNPQQPPAMYNPQAPPAVYNPQAPPPVYNPQAPPPAPQAPPQAPPPAPAGQPPHAS